jgi:hypothetical protein
VGGSGGTAFPDGSRDKLVAVVLVVVAAAAGLVVAGDTLSAIPGNTAAVTP